MMISLMMESLPDELAVAGHLQNLCADQMKYPSMKYCQVSDYLTTIYIEF